MNFKIKGQTNMTTDRIKEIQEKTAFPDSVSVCQALLQVWNECADTSKVTRFEVIDENGRVYTSKDCKVELSYQDDGRTLKVFINPLNKQD